MHMKGRGYNLLLMNSISVISYIALFDLHSMIVHVLCFSSSDNFHCRQYIRLNMTELFTEIPPERNYNTRTPLQH